MTYTAALEWLFATQKFGIKLGLENTVRLLGELGDPQAKLRFIHVAGTNGKGSVCAMAESILRASGCRTGLFTSPHLVDFCERIRVNGENVPQDFVTEKIGRIREITASWRHVPTFFEIVTALALDYFAREKCEIVILETGMGGRLDATNSIMPLVSVITSISHDHEKWLGASLEEIATEKAGIIKPEIPVVSAQQERGVASVIATIASERKSPLTIVSDTVSQEEIGLAGDHQKYNAALAIAAIRMAGISITDEVIFEGLKSVEWPGRFQILDGRYILDGAHNPAGARQLAHTFQKYFPDKKAVIIFGALQDKDASAMISALREIATCFLFVPVDSDRTIPPASFNKNPLLKGMDCRTFKSLKSALASSRTANPLLITGSLFLIGEALALLHGKDLPRRSLQ